MVPLVFTCVVGLTPPPAPGYVVGRVTGLNDRPLAGAVVGSGGCRATADAAGRFRLGPLPPSAAPGRVLYADYDGLTRAYRHLPPVLPGTDIDTGDLYLPAGRRQVVEVIDDAGGPVANVRMGITYYMSVRSRNGQGVGPEIAIPPTDAAGRTTCLALPPPHFGRLSPTDLRIGRGTLDALGLAVRQYGVSPDDPDVWRVTVVRAAATICRGRVVDAAGRGVGGAEALALDGPNVFLAARTDATGTFTLTTRREKVPVYHVTAFGFHRATVPAQADGTTITLTPAPTHTLAVTDAATGRFVAGADVTYRLPPDADLPPPLIPGLPPEPDDFALFEPAGPGRTAVQVLPPGGGTFEVTADGYAPARVAAPGAEAGASVIPVPMTPLAGPPTPNRVIAGTPTRAGKPVAAGWATAYRLQRRQGRQGDNPAVARGRVVPEPPDVAAEGPVADGRFTLALPADRPGDGWYVAVHEAGQSSGVVGPVAVPWTDVPFAVEVPTPAGGAVAGLVAVPDALDGRAWVVAFDRAGRRYEAQVNGQGRYHLDRLPPGEYGLKAGFDGGRDADADPWAAATRVTVRPGQATRADELELPKHD